MIVVLLMLYGKEPLGAREYGNVFGYMVALVSVLVGTVSKDMIVMVMVSFLTFCELDNSYHDTLCYASILYWR